MGYDILEEGSMWNIAGFCSPSNPTSVVPTVAERLPRHSVPAHWGKRGRPGEWPCRFQSAAEQIR